MKSVAINLSKIIVGLAAIFFFVEVAEIAKSQEWSGEFAILTNWGMMWQTVFFGLLAFNMYRLMLKVERQDEIIKRMYRDMIESRDLRANYTINHSERLNTIEHKIGIR